MVIGLARSIPAPLTQGMNAVGLDRDQVFERLRVQMARHWEIGAGRAGASA
jgi:hypothetical protein